jgi:hypothetical protein
VDALEGFKKSESASEGFATITTKLTELDKEERAKAKTLGEAFAELSFVELQSQVDLSVASYQELVKAANQASAALKGIGPPVQGRMFGGVIRGFAGGGSVGNTDTVPAMLTPGEFVVNRAATEKNRHILEAINSGKIQGFQDGGHILGDAGSQRSLLAAIGEGKVIRLETDEAFDSFSNAVAKLGKLMPEQLRQLGKIANLMAGFKQPEFSVKTFSPFESKSVTNIPESNDQMPGNRFSRAKVAPPEPTPAVTSPISLTSGSSVQAAQKGIKDALAVYSTEGFGPSMSASQIQDKVAIDAAKYSGDLADFVAKNGGKISASRGTGKGSDGFTKRLILGDGQEPSFASTQRQLETINFGRSGIGSGTGKMNFTPQLTPLTPLKGVKAEPTQINTDQTINISMTGVNDPKKFWAEVQPYFEQSARRGTLRKDF